MRFLRRVVRSAQTNILSVVFNNIYSLNNWIRLTIGPCLFIFWAANIEEFHRLIKTNHPEENS
jgi:hypothetical protein